MDLPKYVIEYMGYNDGLPYEDASTSSLKDAERIYESLRKDSPKVGYRLIQVLKEDGPLNG